MGTLPAFGVLDIDRTWGNGSPLLQVRAPYGGFDLPKALIASIAAILLGMARRTSVGCTKAICSTKQIGGVRMMRIEEKSASEDDTDLSNRDAASAGGERDCRGMYDLYSRASVKCDSQLPSPREKARPSRQGLLDRRCNRRADDFVCLASAPDRDRLLGSVVLRCGEFSEFGTAYYHSAVNYTTLGYGDIVMSPAWRLLGPVEAANGMLMFGVSTAMIFAVIQRLIGARFADLKD